MNTTKVIFRVFVRKVTSPEKDDVIAFFPEIPGTIKWGDDCLCYCSTGQHSAASLGYYQHSTRPATEAEYKDLMTELTSYGYNLKVAKHMSQMDTIKRKEQVNL